MRRKESNYFLGVLALGVAVYITRYAFFQTNPLGIIESREVRREQTFFIDTDNNGRYDSFEKVKYELNSKNELVEVSRQRGRLEDLTSKETGSLKLRR